MGATRSRRTPFLEDAEVSIAGRSGRTEAAEVAGTERNR